MIERIASLCIGYAIGMLIMTSYWISRAKKVDITKQGSGNPGTTNMGRVLGKKAAAFTLIGDLCKAFLSALICCILFGNSGVPVITILLYSGLGVILGHNYPFLFGFKGGKGIAASSGVFLSFMFAPGNYWILCVVGVLTFIWVLFATRYMALASLCLITGFCIEFIIWGAVGNAAASGLTGNLLIESDIIIIIIGVLAFIRHSSNIKRLMKGEEHKVLTKKKSTGERG